MVDVFFVIRHTLRARHRQHRQNAVVYPRNAFVLDDIHEVFALLLDQVVFAGTRPELHERRIVVIPGGHIFGLVEINLAKIAVIGRRQVWVVRLLVERCVVELDGLFVILVFLIEQRHLVVNNAQKRPVFTVFEQFIIFLEKCNRIAVFRRVLLGLPGVRLDDVHPRRFSLHVDDRLVGGECAVRLVHPFIQLCEDEPVTRFLFIGLGEFGGQPQFCNRAVFLFHVQIRLGHRGIGIGKNLVFELDFLKQFLKVLHRQHIVFKTHVGFLAPDLGFVDFVAFGVFVQHVIERIERRQITFVIVARLAQHEVGFVHLRVFLGAVNVHRMLLDGFGGFFLRAGKIGVRCGGLAWRQFFLTWLHTLNGQDFPIIVGISRLEFLDAFVQRNPAVVQDVVFGAQRVRIP